MDIGSDEKNSLINTIIRILVVQAPRWLAHSLFGFGDIGCRRTCDNVLNHFGRQLLIMCNVKARKSTIISISNIRTLPCHDMAHIAAILLIQIEFVTIPQELVEALSR